MAVAHHRIDDEESRVSATAREAIAQGLRTHGPDAVGLALKGGLGCVLAAFSHFVLGVAVPPAAGLGAAAAAGFGLAERRKRS